MSKGFTRTNYYKLITLAIIFVAALGLGGCAGTNTKPDEGQSGTPQSGTASAATSPNTPKASPVLYFFAGTLVIK